MKLLVDKSHIVTIYDVSRGIAVELLMKNFVDKASIFGEIVWFKIGAIRIHLRAKRKEKDIFIQGSYRQSRVDGY